MFDLRITYNTNPYPYYKRFPKTMKVSELKVFHFFIYNFLTFARRYLSPSS